MPPANNIGFSATSDMVTSTIGVQTSCPTSPTNHNFYNDEDEDDICPKHFTDIHKCKLEDTFSRKQKPDDIQLQIIAMECNLLYKDVRDWFRKRRLKWMEELVRSENTLRSTSDSSSNNNREYNKQNFTAASTTTTTNSTSNVVSASDSNNNSMVVANTNKQKQQNNINNKHQQPPSSIDDTSSSFKNKNMLKNNTGSVGRNHHGITTT
ncbi:probable serine/threonine-protein kinase DDB_G0283337 [Clytia hemisphaerica]|uniref:Homeobox domain-containing protein n=1 Tax=Clytia hemisphaerica TaxID=252671 RepID=A0A7M6DLQ5_9CNID|eukprot:TCONS_00067459-protein